jgi:uncharacterized protein YbaR (Trm112 family)
MVIPEELMQKIVCPVCRNAIVALPNDAGFECTSCHRVYPVRDGLAVLLPEEATIARS